MTRSPRRPTGLPAGRASPHHAPPPVPGVQEREIERLLSHAMQPERVLRLPSIAPLRRVVKRLLDRLLDPRSGSGGRDAI